MRRRGIVFAAALALSLPVMASAQTISLDADGDVWVREVSPTTTFENDWVSVWSSTNGDEAGARIGLIQWDISSLAGQPIDSAKLSLWVGDDFSGTTRPIKQSAFVIDTTGGTDIFSMTWNTLLTEHPALGTPLEALGSYDQGVPLDLGIEGTFQDSDPGSAADLTLLSNIANTTGILTIVMVADEDGSDYRGDWGDGSNAGGGGFGPDTPGKLIVTIPEPSTLGLLSLGALGLLRRRRA